MEIEPEIRQLQLVVDNHHRFLEHCQRILWPLFNKKYFENKLYPIKIDLMKSDNVKTLGKYIGTPIKFSPARKIKFIDRYLIFIKNHREEGLAAFRNTLLHEMCHQYVYEVLNLENEHHGSNWQKCMIDCGLSPERYSKYELKLFRTDVEQKAIDTASNNRNEFSKKNRKLTTISNFMACKYFMPLKNIFQKCLIVKPGKTKTEIIVNPKKDSWLSVPTVNLYELDNQEEKDAIEKSPAFIAKYKDILKSKGLVDPRFK